ncbi:MAG: prepilin-type N-terminal cleavage/methylation domain-containing protein [bacterium]
MIYNIKKIKKINTQEIQYSFNDGFTLIELIIVVSIIAILSGL